MLEEFNDLISRWRQHPVAHTQHGRAEIGNEVEMVPPLSHL